MDSWIKGLWAKNKIFFILLLPVIILAIFKDILMEYLIGSARKMTREAREKDGKLKSDLDKINAKADEMKRQADELGKEDPEDDPDWHKKL